MKANEIISDVLASVNAQITRRKCTAERLHKLALDTADFDMIGTTNAQIKILERIEKDLIQVEMNAKISYMGINTD